MQIDTLPRLLALTFLWLALSGCSSLLVNQYAFYPTKHDASVPALDNEWVNEIQIETKDGEQLQAFYYPQPQSTCALLYLHGSAGSAYRRVDRLQPIADLGCSLLLLSYRGYGKSTGRPTEQGVYLDARAALNYLKEQGFETQQTIVLGRSVGAAVAVDLAQDQAIGGLILVTPFSSGRDLARAQGLGFALWLIGEPFDSQAKLARVSAPILVVLAGQDRTVPAALGKKLFAAYNGQKEQVLLEEAAHNDIMKVAEQQYLQALKQFIRGVVN